MRRYLVCGSRTWTNEETIERVLSCLQHPARVVTGGADGADDIAHRVARELGFHTQVMLAEWEVYGRSAGMRRNIAMLDARPRIVIAFWDGMSRGTAHTIREAVKRGIPTMVVKEDY